MISEILRRVWDGIGGILKGYLRRVNVRFLAWNPDVDNPERDPVLCGDARIRTAEHVYQQLERSFGTEAWRQTAEEKARAISRFSFSFMAGVIGQYLLFGAYDEDKDSDNDNAKQ